MMERLNLSQAEKKFLSRFNKNVEKIYITYTAMGFSFCCAAVGLILSLLTKKNDGYMMAIIFCGLGINLFLLSRSYQKLFQIIDKMTQYINALEGESKERGKGTHL